MTRNTGIQGSIALVAVVVIVLVAALGFAGWRMLEKQNSDNQATDMPAGSSAEVILTQDDLNEAEQSLSDLDLSDNNADTAQQQADL